MRFALSHLLIILLFLALPHNQNFPFCSDFCHRSLISLSLTPYYYFSYIHLKCWSLCLTHLKVCTHLLVRTCTEHIRGLLLYLLRQGGTKKGTRWSLSFFLFFFFFGLKEDQKKNKPCTEGSFSMSLYFPKFCWTIASSAALIQILRETEACTTVYKIC